MMVISSVTEPLQISHPTKQRRRAFSHVSVLLERQSKCEYPVTRIVTGKLWRAGVYGRCWLTATRKGNRPPEVERQGGLGGINLWRI